MFRNLKKAIFGNPQDESPKENKIDKASQFFGSILSNLSKELFVTKFKLKNLAVANHKLGFKHLKNGDVSDALFRFKFIKKFWPQNYDARFALAYCFALKDDFTTARLELTKLQNENSSYADKIAALLVAIGLAESNQQKIDFNLDNFIDTNHQLDIIFDEEEKQEETSEDKAVEDQNKQEENSNKTESDDEILGSESFNQQDQQSFKNIVKILNEDDKK